MKKEEKKVEVPRFPSTVIAPVGKFLQARLKMLERRKKEISKEDPFKDPKRVVDNAATDMEADEQYGHARTSALKNAIGRTSVQIRKALTRIKIGKYGICEECGRMIDTDRLMIYPEATLCAEDAAKREK
jgi:RNA polymerase-binding transcription factor DksA